MTMKSIEINIPEELVEYMGTGNDSAAELRNAMILYPYVKDGTISFGKAAEMLGEDKVDLIRLYGHLGLPYFDQTPQELETELSALRKRRGAVVC